MESALCSGQVFHQRFKPTQHKFQYKMLIFWLKLSELPELARQTKYFGFNQRAWAEFRRSDYVGHKHVPLEQAVLEKMNELASGSLTGDVYFLGQIRMLGLYFSPVNFYFLRQPNGYFSHMLAEVSNTPWNQRHYYLVDLADQTDTDKRFHVSPFNPMDMVYRWHIKPPADTFEVGLDCIKGEKHFLAKMALQKMPLNSKSLLRVLLSTPSMTLKTVVGIYWQAIKLFIKGTPVYSYPQQKP